MPKNLEKPPQARPPEPPARSRFPTMMSIVIVAVIGLVVAYQVRQRMAAPAPVELPVATTPASATPSVQPANGPLQLPAATEAGDAVPATAKFGPHTQDTYPPLPDVGFPPPRPAETVEAVYKFAAEHPEVLSYIPCYCGCGSQGHKGNDDCFVARRNAKGDVQAWDSHGMT